MTREQEFEQVVKVLADNIENADCGIFNTRNIMGDPMANIFSGEYFSVDICPWYDYYEVFGCTAEEWQNIRKIYTGLQKLQRLKEEDDLK